MKLDSIVTSVIKQFEERSIKGKEKYGTDLDREDLALSNSLFLKNRILLVLFRRLTVSE